MTMTIAELDSRVYLSLKPAAEYIDLDAVHNSVIQRVNIRTMQSRHSSTNVLLATSDEFTPDVIPYDITSLIGKSVVAWLEIRQTTDTNDYPGWQQVRIIPLSQLGQYRQLGYLAAAFDGDETADNEAQAIQYLHFTYLPRALCRIRFDRDNQRTSLDAETLLPDNLSELIVREAQNDVIPGVQLAVKMDGRRDEAGRKDADGIIMMLDKLYVQNTLSIRDLDALWRVWAYSDRARESNFNKPSPRSGALYGDGWRNRWGGGYGGY